MISFTGQQLFRALNVARAERIDTKYNVLDENFFYVIVFSDTAGKNLFKVGKITLEQ